MEEDILAYEEQILQGVIPEALESLKGAIVLVGSGGHYPIPLSTSYPLIGIHVNFYQYDSDKPVYSRIITSVFCGNARVVWDGDRTGLRHTPMVD
jgi:hypothetical protein